MKTLRYAFCIAAGAIVLTLSAVSCALPAITTQRRALVIGISDYINPTINDLTYPFQDAMDMKTTLETKGWLVDELLDHDATKTTIQTRIASFFSGLPTNGTALIYYSGHGTQIGSTSYLIPSDYDDALSVKGPMISPAEMSAWITDSITTRNIIFIADSCRSGGFVASGDSLDGIASPYDSSEDGTIWITPLPTIARFADLLGLNAAANGNLDMITLSASGPYEDSWETGDLGNGVFTYFLLEAAAEGDRDGNGFVTCTEAYSYAARKVDTYWNDEYSIFMGFYPHITGGWRDLVLF